MEKVLIYGDSNVWGDNFITGMRIPEDKQWPKILKKHMQNIQIFQEGLPGRLAGDEETEKKYKNGKDTFMAIFKTHAPLDKIIIMLGTNDLQIKYEKSSKKIIEDLLWYKKVIEEEFIDLENRKKYFINEKMPEFLYILPINFDYEKRASVIFNQDSEAKREEINEFFIKSAYHSIPLKDMELFEDGIHLNYKGHEMLASMVERSLENGKQV